MRTSAAESGGALVAKGLWAASWLVVLALVGHRVVRKNTGAFGSTLGGLFRHLERLLTPDSLPFRFTVRYCSDARRDRAAE